MGNLPTSWQDQIIIDAETKLQRPLHDYERRFIVGRWGFIALEMIHDTVKSASPERLEQYLASQRHLGGR